MRPGTSNQERTLDQECFECKGTCVVTCYTCDGTGVDTMAGLVREVQAEVGAPASTPQTGVVSSPAAAAARPPPVALHVSTARSGRAQDGGLVLGLGL